MVQTFDPHPVRIGLRQTIQSLIETKGWKRKHLAEASGIDAVTISNILNGKQSMQLHQLDAITSALDLPRGHFYDEFIAECCNEHGRLTPAKIGEFILQCSLLKKHQTIGKLVHLLLEDENIHKIVTVLQDIAETLYHSPEKIGALPYYEKIISLDPKREERLALSLYRRFLLLKEVDLKDRGQEAFYQFLSHLRFLPHVEEDETLLLDAYREILLFYEIVEKWESHLRYAYEFERVAKQNNDSAVLCEALINQITACTQKADYIKALQIIELLSLKGDEYARIAEGKKLLVLVTMGQYQHIEAYLQWARTKEERVQVFPAAINSYLKHDMLQEAAAFIERHHLDMEDAIHSTDYHQQGLVMRLIEARTAYYFAAGEILHALFDLKNLIEQSWKLGNINRIKRHADKVIQLLIVSLQTMMKVFGNFANEKDVPPSGKITGTPSETK